MTIPSGYDGGCEATHFEWMPMETTVRAKRAASRRDRPRRPTPLIALWGTLAAVVIALCEWFGLFSPLENLLYDARVRYCQFAVRPPSDQIVHIDIDDDTNHLMASVPEVGAWP